MPSLKVIPKTWARILPPLPWKGVHMQSDTMSEQMGNVKAGSMIICNCMRVLHRGVMGGHLPRHSSRICRLHSWQEAYIYISGSNKKLQYNKNVSKAFFQPMLLKEWSKPSFQTGSECMVFRIMIKGIVWVENIFEDLNSLNLPVPSKVLLHLLSYI